LPKGRQPTAEGFEQVFQAATKGHEEIGECTAEGPQAGSKKKRLTQLKAIERLRKRRRANSRCAL